jgi:NADH dehydrogenase
MELVEESDKNKDGKIDFEEFEDMGMTLICGKNLLAHTALVQAIKRKIPMAENHLSQVDTYSRRRNTD